MLIEIVKHDINEEVYYVYKCYNESLKLFESKPYCLIAHDDFVNLLTDYQFECFENRMEKQFKINIKDLIINCIKIY